MIEIEQNKWLQLPTHFYRQLKTIYQIPAKDFLHPQMPAFQLRFFIHQAFKRNQLITIWLTDQEDNEYPVTGKIKQHLLKQDSFLIKSQESSLTYLANFSQIKYLALATEIDKNRTMIS